jgi:hypothetical protein
VTNNEGQHVALPKLYGAPAYARPPAAVAHTTRPIDPDDLPLEAERTEEEQALARTIEARPYAGAAPAAQFAAREGAPMLRARPFRLRTIADRLLRNAGDR